MGALLYRMRIPCGITYVAHVGRCHIKDRVGIVGTDSIEGEQPRCLVGEPDQLLQERGRGRGWGGGGGLRELELGGGGGGGKVTCRSRGVGQVGLVTIYFPGAVQTDRMHQTSTV